MPNIDELLDKYSTLTTGDGNRWIDGEHLSQAIAEIISLPVKAEVMPKIADLIEMPGHIKIFNASTERCDMLQGPCACGAYHKLTDWKVESNFSA